MPNKKLLVTLIVSLFSTFTAWWIWLSLFAGSDDPIRNYFTDTYGTLAGVGGIIGLLISQKWGGLKSYVGRTVSLFSLGILFQFLGQLSYTIEYYFLGIENSYPSFGEVFFLLSIPCYILGVWYIAKASGSAISLKNMKSRLSAVILPLLMMCISYYMFIYGNQDAEASFVANLLFFIYPLGQAIFVSFAVLAYYLTEGVLGGVMRQRVFFILFSLIFQYGADTLFFYKTIQGTWYPGDVSEYMFVVSYFLMSIAFIKFLSVFEKLKKVE